LAASIKTPRGIPDGTINNPNRKIFREIGKIINNAWGVNLLKSKIKAVDICTIFTT